MDYTFFIKNRFLNSSVGDFTNDFEKTDYKGFEKIVSKNTIWGMGKIAIKVCRKEVQSIFGKIDGIELKDTQNPTEIRKDGYVDKDELYQLIKTSYEDTKGEKINDEKISKMTIREAVDIIINYFSKQDDK